MNDTVLLGRLLKSLRSLAGRSQAQIASKTDLHPGSISLAERGVRPLSAKSYVRVLLAISREMSPESHKTKLL